MTDSQTTPRGPLRTHQVIVRTTDEEWERWNAAARSAGYGRTATWLRRVADERAAGDVEQSPTADVSPVVLAEVVAIRQELARLGNNFNQLVRAAHVQGVSRSVAADAEWAAATVDELTRKFLNAAARLAGDR